MDPAERSAQLEAENAELLALVDELQSFLRKGTLDEEPGEREAWQQPQLSERNLAVVETSETTPISLA